MHNVVDDRPNLTRLPVHANEIEIDTVKEERERLENDAGGHHMMNAVDVDCPALYAMLCLTLSHLHALPSKHNRHPNDGHA